MIRGAYKDAFGEEPGDIVVERPRQGEHGDFATNIMLQEDRAGEAGKLAKTLGELDQVTSAEAVNGFVNVFLAPAMWHEQVRHIHKKEAAYGAEGASGGRKINVEFISANPTGPLTLGNARGGFIGDVVANVLGKAGHEVVREYYFNDAGTQVRKLVDSFKDHVQGAVTEDTQYTGEYMQELADELGEEAGALDDEALANKLTETIFERYIKGAIEKMGITFDVWTNERDILAGGVFTEAMQELEEKGLLYEQEGAQWLGTEQLGDSRDRVITKSEGDTTYLGTDIAYHLDILKKRDFDTAVKVWGADHAGQVPSLQLTMKELVPKKKMEFVIVQWVRLIKGGEEFKISKRAGTYVTVEEVIDEVGADVARFFFCMRSPNAQLDFDLDLAKKESQENPVFYVLYSYARSHQIFEKAGVKPREVKGDPALLTEEAELSLIKKLTEWPEVLAHVVASYEKVDTYEVHQLTTYAMDAARAFHKFYETSYVLVEDEELKEARLSLVRAYQIIMEDVLGVLGIEPREQM